MLNIYDFENVASKVMAKQGFDYYASGYLKKKNFYICIIFFFK